MSTEIKRLCGEVGVLQTNRGRPLHLKHITVYHGKTCTTYNVVKHFGGKTGDGYNPKLINYHYGAYESLEEAMSVRDKMMKLGWPEPKREVNPMRHISKRGPQSYRIMRETVEEGKQYYGNYHVLEYAQFIRDRLEECNWDKSQLDKIKEEYPEYYTRALIFFKDIVKTDSERPWSVRVYKNVDGKSKFETVTSCSRLEDALWERDLYYEYGDDVQAYAEDTRPNPYDNMKVPYWITRRPKGGLVGLQTDHSEEIKKYTEAVKYGATTTEDVAKMLNTSSQTIRNHLRKYSCTFLRFKKMIQKGVEPLEVLDPPKLRILTPDVSYHRSKSNYVHKHNDGRYQIQRKGVYYGAYLDKKVADKVARKLAKCDWDKSELKRIQKECGHKSMMYSKRWVYEHKHPKTKQSYGWCVRRKNKDKRMINYGHYKDYRVACLVRDNLIQYGWDKQYYPMIRDWAEYDVWMIDNCWRCKL